MTQLNPKVTLEIDIILSVMLTNRFPGDQSKTPLSIPFHTEVNLSVDLNHNFIFRFRLCLKLKYNAQSNPKDKVTQSIQCIFSFCFCPVIALVKDGSPNVSQSKPFRLQVHYIYRPDDLSVTQQCHTIEGICY